jgi:hypothetical protein
MDSWRSHNWFAMARDFLNVLNEDTMLVHIQNFGLHPCDEGPFARLLKN